MASELVSLSVKIPPDLSDALKQGALNEDRNISGLVIKILSDHLRKHGLLDKPRKIKKRKQ